MAEQLICNQQVDGSTPFTSSNFLQHLYGGFPERPKGADCKSVVTDFGGPNPPSPTNKKRTFVYRQRCVFWMMFAFGKWCWLRQWWRLRLMMRGFATFWGKHRIIAERSGATSFWAKRKTSYRRRRCIIDWHKYKVVPWKINPTLNKLVHHFHW